MRAGKEDILRFYRSATWHKKSKEIRARDHNECQHCKAKGRVTCGQMQRLDVHHKKHLDTHYELRLSDDNLITLCSSCHNAEHPEKLKQKDSDTHAAKFE